MKVRWLTVLLVIITGGLLLRSMAGEATELNIRANVIQSGCALLTPDLVVEMGALSVATLTQGQSSAIPITLAFDCHGQSVSTLSVAVTGVEDALQPGLLAIAGRARGVALVLESQTGLNLAVNGPAQDLPLATNGELVLLSRLVMSGQSIIPGDYWANASLVINIP
ncbi:fimbrial protein [Aeromonas sobria]|nr:fimbrial protein [Aeromonas sobria]